MNILITAGGTSEKIDQVRSITNTSSGTTALAIGTHLLENDHDVYFLHASKSSSLEGAALNVSFTSSDELQKSMKNILSDNQIDIVIHAAAVSDFIVDKVVINGELFEPYQLNKIDSSDEVEIILKRRSKIIHEIKNMSYKSQPIVVGFKLTNTLEEEDQRLATLKLSESDTVDFVIHNDLNFISEEQHKFKVYFKDTILFEGNTKEELCKSIIRIVQLCKDNQLAKEFAYT